MDRDEIFSLNVEQLRSKLDELDLPRTGNKELLRERLLVHFKLKDEDGGSKYEDTIADLEEDFGTGHVSSFTLRDIRDSVSTFSGDGLPEIGQWIGEFEDCAYAVKWNSLQRFIYSKQLLTGAARIFARSQSGIRDWASLKQALISEFGSKLSSLEVHKLLRNRRKRVNETLREYLYSLQEIGQPINLDVESLIQYFIDGIADHRSNKSVLYQSRTLEELKENIKVYERVRLPEPSSSGGNRPRIIAADRENNKKVRRCYTCNSQDHMSNSCPNKEVKCFRCQGVGHKSYECKVVVRKELMRNRNGSFTRGNDVVHTLSDGIMAPSRRIFKDITISGKTVSAIVDTGSDVCAIRYDMLFILDEVDLNPGSKSLVGIGGATIETIGYFTTRIETDGIELEVTFHVVRENDMLYSIVLGNDIFHQVDLVIDGTSAKFRERSASEEPVKDKTKLDSSPIDHLRSEFGDILSSATHENKYEDNLELEHLEDHIRKQVENMISSYKPTKSRKETPIKMKLILKDEIPVSQAPRRMSYSDQQIVNQQIREWLREGIIRPSQSAYAAPIVLTGKKDGSKRLCCDYRKLNEKIVRDNFPMVVMDDVIQRLQSAKVFTTLDLRNGFFHVPMEPDSRKYTAFVTHNGVYEFLYVPFGISNSPAVFCRYIATVFRELLNDGTLITYMDDVVIPAGNEEEGLQKMKKVLKVAEANGLRIKWNKCQFLKRKINFLGYVIENSAIKPSEEKTKAVSKFPLPQNQKALQRFLGLTSYFRRFIPSYAIIAKPLTDLLRKDCKFKMDDVEKLAFNQLRNSLVTAPVLRLFDPTAATEIHTDASMYGYGAVLLQQDSENSSMHPVEYMSRKTTQMEQKYHSYELEVLAVIEALKKWRIYVLGLKFKIVTDCNAFALTMRKKDVPPRVSRWALFLQDFDYSIEHRSGSKMKHVDALSRASCLMIEDKLRYRIKEAQMKDEWIRAIRKVLEKDAYEDYFIKYDILHKDPNKELIVVPSSMEKEIMQIAHRQGHFASKKTQELVEKSFYIPDLKIKVDHIVKACVECIVSEAKRGRKEGYLCPIDKADRPLVTYHIDHVGPMETTHKQYNHILVVVDAFSKFVWLYPTKSTGSNEVIDRLERQAITFGNPARVITDRGTAFTSKAFEDYCENEKIQHLVIATGVPRGNGQVERIHRTIISILTKLCAENATHWYKHVERVQRVINSTATRSTGFPPFTLLTGVEMRCKEDLDLRNLLDKSWLEELSEERDKVREEARNNIMRIQKENKKTFNKNRIPETVYEVGELVAIKRTQFGAGLKLRPKFLGPYRVARRLEHGRYEVEKLGKGEGPNRTITVVEFLKKWEPHSGRMPLSGGPNVGFGNVRPSRQTRQKRQDN